MRRLGAVVILMDGKAGLPDLMVGYQGRTILMEIKDPDSKWANRKSQRGVGGLDPDQAVFFAKWCGGPCLKIETVEEAIAALRS